jgi:hypothetical protein
LEGGQRQDRVVIRLCHGVSNAKALHVNSILFDNFLTDQRIMMFHPRKQGRTNIEANLFKVSQFSIWPVAFCVDTFVPIWKWRCPNFFGYDAGKWIFPGWLIEMSMNAKGIIRHLQLL